MDPHIRTHTQEKPFICNVNSCPYSATQPSSLKRHRKFLHPPPEGRLIKSQRWSCYFCLKSFTSLPNLVTHSRSHTLEEPFTCGLCHKRFRDYEKLRRHTMEKPFKCEECQKSFTRTAELRYHIGAVHRQKKIPSENSSSRKSSMIAKGLSVPEIMIKICFYIQRWWGHNYTLTVTQELTLF